MTDITYQLKDYAGNVLLTDELRLLQDNLTDTMIAQHIAWEIDDLHKYEAGMYLICFNNSKYPY
jgi:hypothetical protein